MGETQTFYKMLTDATQFASMLDILDKWGEVNKLRHNRIQRHFLKNRSLGSSVIDLVVKARQATMTTCIIADQLRINLARPSRHVTLMDLKSKTADIRAVADRMYESIPERLLIDNKPLRRPAMRVSNQDVSQFENGSRWALGTAGSFYIGRGTTFDVLVGSEVAFWKDAAEIVKGAQQAARYAIWRVYESTTNGAQGWFFDRVNEALDPKNNLYKVHFYPWWWVEEYQTPRLPGEVMVYEPDEADLVRRHGLKPEQIKWRRLGIQELGAIFQQEYPEDIHTCFLHSGFGYFGDVDQYFTAPSNAQPDATHTYVAGLDFGQQVDFTAFYILDATTNQFVDLLHINRERWSDIRAEIRRYIKKWNVRHMRAEANAMGSSEIEILRHECDEEGLEVSIWSFDMTASSKPALMRTYRSAMQDAGLRHPRSPLVLAEHRAARSKLTAKGWTLESPRDSAVDGTVTGHGDTVVAAALAWSAAIGIG